MIASVSGMMFLVVVGASVDASVGMSVVDGASVDASEGMSMMSTMFSSRRPGSGAVRAVGWKIGGAV